MTERSSFGWRSWGAIGALLLTCVAILPAAAQAQGPACTITWDGQLSSRWFEIDTRGTGDPDDDVYNWTPERYPNQTDHVCIPSGSVVNTNQVTTNTPDIRSFAISAGATLSITDVQVGARENSTNAGTLNMAPPVTNPANANVVLTIGDAIAANGDESLTNTGVINFPPRATPSSPRAIFCDLIINQGTINVDTPEASIQEVAAGSGAVHTNTGTINVSPGNNLRVLFSNFTNGSGGVITGGGSMNIDNSRFEISGNSQIGAGTDVNVSNTTLAGTAGSAATGNVDIVGTSTLEGSVAPGIVVDVEPEVTLRSPAVDTTVNAGRININGPNSQLQVLPNDNTNSTSKLTNTGTIEFTPSGSGFRTLTGDVVNTGNLLVNHPEASFQFPGGSTSVPKLTNQGTITISPGNALRAIFSTIVHGQGSVINGGGAVNMDQNRFEISGNSQIGAGTDVNLSNTTLAGTAGSAATGNVDIVGQSTLFDTVPAGIVVDVEPGVTLRAPAVDTTVNAGRININGPNSQLQVLPNDNTNSTSKLTNTGTIEFTPSGSGFRTLTGDVVNTGNLLVNHPEASFQSPGGSSDVPDLTNQGNLTVSAGNTLRVLFATLTNATGGVISGNGTINNEQTVQNTGGVVAPGSSPGTLTFTGNYAQGPGGTLAIEVSGPAPGSGHDQLVVGGTATLGGTLRVSTPGFVPAEGQTFKIIDAPAPPATSITGTFATVEQIGATPFTAAYNPTDVTLTAGATPPPDTDGDGVPDASDNCPTQAGPASNGGCPVVPPPDTDGDGVPDASDECPTQAGPASNGGCPDESTSPACDKAKKKLAAAKKQLRKLQKQDAPRPKVKKAKAKVKKAKAAVKKACA